MSHACIPCIPCIPRSVIYKDKTRCWLVGGQFDYMSLKGKVRAIVCCYSNGHLVCNILVLAQTVHTKPSTNANAFWTIATKCSTIFFSAELVPFRRQLQKEAAWWGIGFHHIHAGWLSSSPPENVAEQSLGVFRANKSWQPWALRNVTGNCFSCCVALQDQHCHETTKFLGWSSWWLSYLFILAPCCSTAGVDSWLRAASLA